MLQVFRFSTPCEVHMYSSRNTYNKQIVKEIHHVFELCDKDDRVRVVILTAEPTAAAYCSGVRFKRNMTAIADRLRLSSRLTSLKVGTYSGRKRLRRRVNMVIPTSFWSRWSITLLLGPPTSSPWFWRNTLNRNNEMSENYDCSHQWACCK